VTNIARAGTPTPGPAEFAAMTGTDVGTNTRKREGMSTFALEDGVVYHTYLCARSGRPLGCTPSSTARPRGATRRTEEASKAEVKMRDFVAVKISVEDNIDGDVGGIKCPSEGRRHERRRHKR
jgi:hypothetical protein